MATNELLPFANGEDANILPTNQWQALTDILENGFQSGIARSEQVNRVLAQGAVASYVLGQLIVDQLNQNATLDEATLYQNLVSALQETAKDVCLPYDGGTMRGAIKFTVANALLRSIDDSWLVLCGGTSAGTNSYIQVKGKDAGGSIGFFAKDGTNTSALLCNPNGSMQWMDKEVERVEGGLSGYIRYSSGLQICWGHVSTVANKDVTVTFPVAFIQPPMMSGVRVSGETTTASVSVWCRGRTTTTAKFYCTNNATGYSWLAVGTWK